MPDRQVSIYKNVLDTIGKPIELSKILHAIKIGHWKNTIEKLRGITEEKEQKAYKNTLPCFTPSGIFSTRTVDGLKEHSGILVVDIDTKENPGLMNECNEIRQHLIEDKYTYFLFDSCRGSGLAIGVLIDKSRHIDTFQFLENYYKDKHGLIIDKGCKDVSRLRFVSHDPQLFLNDKAETVKVPVIEHVLTNYDKIKAIVASGKMLGDDTYESWLKQGFALANEFGEDGRSYYHALSQRSSKYNQVDCDKKYDNCISTNRGAYTFATIMHLAKQAGVTFNGKIMVSKKETVNLAEEVRQWVTMATGNFNVSDVHKELNLITKEQKQAVNKEISRLAKDRVIEKYGEKRGHYRLVDNDLEEMRWYEVTDFTPYDIAMPFEIHKYVKIHKKSIIVVAGTSNAGKTAFMLNTIKLNINKHKIRYFSSELSNEELAERISEFGLPKSDWNYETNFKCYSRSSNFNDVIDPDGLNIIDFLECYEDFYSIGKYISEIHDRLKGGVAIIALQKNPGQKPGIGGWRSVEKARLYLSVDPGVIEIVKGKSWVNRDINPNGMRLNFKLYAGCKFMPQSGWIHP